MIADPICDILVTDALVIAAVAAYEGNPAIFDFAPAPIRCPQPLITVEEEGGPPYGTRASRGSRMRATISIWGNKSDSRAALRDLSLYVWRAIDRRNLTLRPPYYEVGCVADIPREMTDRDGFTGMIINVDVVVLQGSGAL